MAAGVLVLGAGCSNEQAEPTTTVPATAPSPSTTVTTVTTVTTQPLLELDYDGLMELLQEPTTAPDRYTFTSSAKARSGGRTLRLEATGVVDGDDTQYRVDPAVRTGEVVRLSGQAWLKYPDQWITHERLTVPTIEPLAVSHDDARYGFYMMLRSGRGTVWATERSSVGGFETTRYHVDVPKLTYSENPEGSFVADAWITDDGLVARVELDAKGMTEAGWEIRQWTWEMVEADAVVSITPPTDALVADIFADYDASSDLWDALAAFRTHYDETSSFAAFVAAVGLYMPELDSTSDIKQARPGVVGFAGDGDSLLLVTVSRLGTWMCLAEGPEGVTFGLGMTVQEVDSFGECSAPTLDLVPPVVRLEEAQAAAS